jgi:iron-sulfur cluster assembly accessory protein
MKAVQDGKASLATPLAGPEGRGMLASRHLGCASLAYAVVIGIGCDGGPPPGESRAGRSPALADAPRRDDAIPGVSGAKADSSAIGNPAHPVEAGSVVDLTPAAATKLRELAEEMAKDLGTTDAVRVRVLPGGCCGFLHELDLDPEVTPADHAHEAGGFGVVISRRQVDILGGTRIDYGRDGDKTGFIVKSPIFEGEAAKRWLAGLEAQGKAESFGVEARAHTGR